MLVRMSAIELAEWKAFDALEPIGEPRADLRAGIIASLVWNANWQTRKTPFDFMPYAAGPLTPAAPSDAPAADPEQVQMEADMKSFFQSRAA